LINSSAISTKNHNRTGLSAEQAIDRGKEIGENVNHAEKPVSEWSILLNQLKSKFHPIILAEAQNVSVLLSRYRSTPPIPDWDFRISNDRINISILIASKETSAWIHADRIKTMVNSDMGQKMTNSTKSSEWG
jgi:magnesium-transporting ATPase (P-type)